MTTKWNLKQLYDSIDDPRIEEDIEAGKKRIEKFVKKWKDNKEYLKDPKVLKEALDEYEELESSGGACDKPIYYFLLLQNLDQTDTKIKGRFKKYQEISTKLSNDIQFFDINLAKVPKKQQKIFISSPILKEYKHLLESTFKGSEYLLSDKEEKIFNLTSKPSRGNWIHMLTELLDKQELDVINEDKEKVTITYNESSRYLNSKEKKVRDYAAKKVCEVNNKYLEIAEFEINSVLESKKISDEYRGIPRADLPRHLSDDIESEVVDTLVDVVTKNFHISREYYKVKAKLLNQKSLGYHEKNVPLGEIDTEYSYEESMKLVQKTFKSIDPTFFDIVKEFQENGHYDTFPKKGKSGGAFCIDINKNLPTYMLLNHKNKLNDVLTIAHESGHGIHTEMSKKQNSLNCGYPTSLAEVASTFFENFVLEEILKDADEKLQFSILAETINSDISTIFRQVACYNFEKELHEEYRKQGYLSKEYISDLFCKHMHSYLGDAVEIDESMRLGWIYWSHIRNFFYVYSYASGLLISKGLQSLVKEDKKNVELVKEFLSSGSTKSPLELFKDIGIDISKKDIWQKGINEIQLSLDKLL